MKDKEKLIRAGLDWNIVESLPELTETCNRAEINWQLRKLDKKAVVNELQEMIKTGKAVRAKLAGILRKTPFFIQSGFKLPRYSENNTYVDIIEDLYELVHIVNRCQEADPNCIVDATIVKQALDLHNTLTIKRVTAKLFKEDNYVFIRALNCAALELKKALSIIYGAGYIAFIDNPARAALYTFSYYRELNKIRSSKKRIQKKDDKTSVSS
jgi:hypothetical protein